MIKLADPGPNWRVPGPHRRNGPGRYGHVQGVGPGRAPRGDQDMSSPDRDQGD
jgi:hypothetical protein